MSNQQQGPSEQTILSPPDPRYTTAAYRLMYPFLAGKDIAKTIRLPRAGKHRNNRLTALQHLLGIRN